MLEIKEVFSVTNEWLCSPDASHNSAAEQPERPVQTIKVRNPNRNVSSANVGQPNVQGLHGIIAPGTAESDSDSKRQRVKTAPTTPLNTSINRH